MLQATNTGTRPPNPRPGLETNIVVLLEELVREMPQGTARLLISRMPGHPEWTEPYFELCPVNPRAAPIKGVVVDQDGIDLTIGVAAVWDLRAKGGNLLKGSSCEEEFRSVCEAVVSGAFTEELNLNSRGEVISAKGTLHLKGIERSFADHGRWLLLPFFRRETKIVHYEPYF